MPASCGNGCRQHRRPGRYRRPRSAAQDAVPTMAPSNVLDKAAFVVIDLANAFGFWDWVGGRCL